MGCLRHELTLRPILLLFGGGILLYEDVKKPRGRSFVGFVYVTKELERRHGSVNQNKMEMLEDGCPHLDLELSSPLCNTKGHGVVFPVMIIPMANDFE